MLARYNITAAHDLSERIERLDGFLEQRSRNADARVGAST
jgi:hypothetical protein